MTCVQATLIGSFLGGDLLQVESLESVVRGPASEERCLEVLEKLSALLALRKVVLKLRK